MTVSAVKNSARKSAAEGVRLLTGMSVASAYNVVDTGDVSAFDPDVRKQVSSMLDCYRTGRISDRAVAVLVERMCDGYVRARSGTGGTVHRSGARDVVHVDFAPHDSSRMSALTRTHLLGAYRDTNKPDVGRDVVSGRDGQGADLTWMVGPYADGTPAVDRWDLEGDRPHLLVVGQRRSGVSETLKVAFFQMLANNSSSDVQFSVVDPDGTIFEHVSSGRSEVVDYLGRLETRHGDGRLKYVRMLEDLQRLVLERERTFQQHPSQPANLSEARASEHSELHMPYRLLIVDADDRITAGETSGTDAGALLNWLVEHGPDVGLMVAYGTSGMVGRGDRFVSGPIVHKSRKIALRMSGALSERFVGSDVLANLNDGNEGCGLYDNGTSGWTPVRTLLTEPTIKSERATSGPPVTCFDVSPDGAFNVDVWTADGTGMFDTDVHERMPDPVRAARTVVRLIDRAAQHCGSDIYAIPLQLNDEQFTVSAATTGPVVVHLGMSQREMDLRLNVAAADVAVQASAAGAHVHLVEWGTNLASDPRLRNGHVDLYDTFRQWQAERALQDAPDGPAPTVGQDVQFHDAVANCRTTVEQRLDAISQHPNPTLHPRDVADAVRNDEQWWDGSAEHHPFLWQPHVLVLALAKNVHLDELVGAAGPAVGVFTVVISGKGGSMPQPFGTTNIPAR